MITEKKKEEVDNEQREANLIIYRAKESNKENSEERQNEDKQFFDALCNDILGIGPIKIKNIIRLGKKNKVLQSCGGAEDLFKNISISPDYNKDEREKIKALATEAKKNSEEDLNFVYRVRGPPWNLRLKFFCKTLITTKPTKGRRKNTSEDNKEMKKTKLKGECYKSKTAFSMWYTNADTLHNKLPELRNRIKHAKSPPSIIAITEVKPKNTIHPLTEPEIKLTALIYSPKILSSQRVED